jgi:hypothetical protein
MLLELNGLNESTYERVNEVLNLYNNPPKGLVFHTAGPIPGGWRVFDIWESQAAFDQFFTQRLESAFKQVGLTGPPAKQEFFPIHNTFAPQPNLLARVGAAVSR